MQNSDTDGRARTPDRQDDRLDMDSRLLHFAADVITLAPRLQRSPTGRYLVGQMIRAGTSAGANFQEARGAESRADFVHKMQVVLKELRETEYWLRLLRETKVVPPNLLTSPLAEVDELIRIVVKSVVTAKSKCQTAGFEQSRRQKSED